MKKIIASLALIIPVILTANTREEYNYKNAVRLGAGIDIKLEKSKEKELLGSVDLEYAREIVSLRGSDIDLVLQTGLDMDFEFKKGSFETSAIPFIEPAVRIYTKYNGFTVRQGLKAGLGDYMSFKKGGLNNIGAVVNLGSVTGIEYKRFTTQLNIGDKLQFKKGASDKKMTIKNNVYITLTLGFMF